MLINARLHKIIYRLKFLEIRSETIINAAKEMANEEARNETVIKEVIEISEEPDLENDYFEEEDEINESF